MFMLWEEQPTTQKIGEYIKFTLKAFPKLKKSNDRKKCQLIILILVDLYNTSAIDTNTLLTYHVEWSVILP